LLLKDCPKIKTLGKDIYNILQVFILKLYKK